MDLPFHPADHRNGLSEVRLSDARFVRAYPAETTEAFCEGRNAGSCLCGKVTQSIFYDDTMPARIRGCDAAADRGLQRPEFAVPSRSIRQGNDNGKVEGLVGDV